jgi:hypothetical protein
MINSGDLLYDLEKIEMKAWKDFYSAGIESARKLLGIKAINFKGSLIASVSKIDTLAFNRVIGLGISSPADLPTIDEILIKFKAENIGRFFIQLHPLSNPEDLPELLRKNKFFHYNNWVKLFRETDNIIETESSLHVKLIGKENADIFAELIVKNFGWKPEMIPWIASLVGRKRWRHYIAYHEELPVGTAAFYYYGDYAWFDFASTLPEFRHRGAQSILINERLKDAKKLKCKFAVTETAEDKPSKPANSMRNVMRLGFKEAYLRPNFIWKA